MNQSKPLVSFTTNSSSLNSFNSDLQLNILESSHKEKEKLRDLCTEKDKQIRLLMKELEKKNETIASMQQSAGRTVGLANRKK